VFYHRRRKGQTRSASLDPLISIVLPGAVYSRRHKSEELTESVIVSATVKKSTVPAGGRRVAEAWLWKWSNVAEAGAVNVGDGLFSDKRLVLGHARWSHVG